MVTNIKVESIWSLNTWTTMSQPFNFKFQPDRFQNSMRSIENLGNVIFGYVNVLSKSTKMLLVWTVIV